MQLYIIENLLVGNGPRDKSSYHNYYAACFFMHVCRGVASKISFVRPLRNTINACVTYACITYSNPFVHLNGNHTSTEIYNLATQL